MTIDPDPDLWRARVTALLDDLAAADAATRDDRAPVTLDQQSVGRLARMDAMERQAMAKATHARRAVETRRLRAALARLEAGEFGWCADCGERIPDARLEIDPAAAKCADCAGA